MKLCYMSTPPEGRGPMPVAWMIEFTQKPVSAAAAGPPNPPELGGVGGAVSAPVPRHVPGSM